MCLSRILTEHASETLAGIKAASLISLKGIDEENLSLLKELEERGLKSIEIRGKNGTPLLFLYRKKLLNAALNDERAREALSSLGYKGNLEDDLELLRKRFQIESCPHEIGFFLSYPAEDVLGFIKHGGKNYKCSHMWKVYCDEKKAESLYKKFLKCRKVYKNCYENGFSIKRLCISA